MRLDDIDNAILSKQDEKDLENLVATQIATQSGKLHYLNGWHRRGNDSLDVKV